MLTHRACPLYLTAVLAAGSAAAPAAIAEPPGRAVTCAAIAQETRALVAAAVKASPVPVAVDLILKALAPLGTCVEPVVGGGQWALVLNAPPNIKFENLESFDDVDSGQGDDDELPSVLPTTPTAWTTVDDWTPVFVTADGRRVSAESTPLMPTFEAYIDAAGAPVAPLCPRTTTAVELFIRPAANADGSLSAAFVNQGAQVALFRFDGETVAVDPAQHLLPSITNMGDLDKDGRVDLSDSEGLALRTRDGDYLFPLQLIAMARPDGTFTIDHPFITATYGKECEGLGRSPWVLGKLEATDAVANIACARLFGVPTATIKAGIAAERASLTADDGYATVPAWDVFQVAPEDLSQWFDREIPVYTARADGFQAAAVASVTASTALEASGVYRFDAAQAVDGDLGTSWQAKRGRGAWVELKLQGAQTIVALDVANGFQRSDKLGDLFALNGRGTRIRVTAGGKTFDLVLDPNVRGFQRVDLPEAVVTDTVRVTFKATAKGSRWGHLAVSEIVPLTR